MVYGRRPGCVGKGVDADVKYVEPEGEEDGEADGVAPVRRSSPASSSRHPKKRPWRGGVQGLAPASPCSSRVDDGSVSGSVPWRFSNDSKSPTLPVCTSPPREDLLYGSSFSTCTLSLPASMKRSMCFEGSSGGSITPIAPRSRAAQSLRCGACLGFEPDELTDLTK